jgi:S-(hydroxymethyl)glutathione dehydrogenase/alcohol dehydrogenase
MHQEQSLGHEGAGTVLAIGPGVTQVHAGDHVILSWIKGEGKNAPGASYKNSRGEKVNSGQVATFQEFTVVSENRCTPVPEALPLDVAALLGCAVPTGAGIVLNELRVQPQSSLAVVGLGGIGLSAVLAGRFAGCSRIVAIDIHRAKLELAAKLGATLTVDARDENAVSPLINTMDYVVEASGAKPGMELGFKLAKPGGGRFMIAGNLRVGETISIDPFALIKGKHIAGTAGGSTKPSTDFPRYATAFLEDKFQLRKLITHTGKIENINELFGALGRGEILGRAMITFSS